MVERGQDSGGHQLAPLEFTLLEVVVMLNRAGVSMHDAYHVRPPWEVEALLMSQVAESQQAQRDPETGDVAGTEDPLNPPDTPAPAWVDELDT